jgi:hypothetical protein
VSVLLRDDLEQRELTVEVPLERVGPPVPVNELVEHLVDALGFLDENGVAVRLCLVCDRWTSVSADRALIEGLLLGLSLRAFDENGSEVTGLPTGEYVRVSVSDTGGWSEDAGNAWTTRMGSPQGLERPSLAALRHAAEIVGGALVCARHASCGERANLYLPATRRHVRPVLTSN